MAGLEGLSKDGIPSVWPGSEDQVPFPQVPELQFGKNYGLDLWSLAHPFHICYFQFIH